MNEWINWNLYMAHKSLHAKPCPFTEPLWIMCLVTEVGKEEVLNYPAAFIVCHSLVMKCTKSLADDINTRSHMPAFSWRHKMTDAKWQHPPSSFGDFQTLIFNTADHKSTENLLHVTSHVNLCPLCVPVFVQPRGQGTPRPPGHEVVCAKDLNVSL